MTFNRGIKTDPGRARSSRGRGGVAAAGGGLGLVGVIVVFLISQATGVDVSRIVNQPAAGGGSEPGVDLSHCVDAEAANEDVNCRMVAGMESIDVMWDEILPAEAGTNYTQPGLEIFENSVSSACGQASSATGPFYCPGDDTIYIDTSFFQVLEDQLGATNAPLAQTYILAHEAAHHIQNLEGTLSSADRSQTGEMSDEVRLELQADCYAGMWVGHAATTVDPESGVTFLQEPTAEQVQDALDAAAAVGDDRIQQTQTGQVRPDTFTHGTSEQRMQWFTTGYEQGTMQSCDTFSTDDL